MDNPSIEVAGLRTRFGPTVALDGMIFSVGAGRVTGFGGPNGAGKSTRTTVILGLDATDESRALVCGQLYTQLHRPLKNVGSLLDAGPLHPSRPGRNHVLWLAHSQDIPAKRVDAMIALVGHGPAARRKASGYALGMRQLRRIVAAILGDPPVVIWPFNGTDPEGIILIGHLPRSLAAEGRAILVSSHLAGEQQNLADDIVVGDRGRVLADASADQALARTPAPGEAARALQHAGSTNTRLDAKPSSCPA